MVIDYAVLKTALEHVTQKLDHSYLNEITEIGNPTSENIAKYIFGHVRQSLPEAPKLEKVRVWESPRSWCEYIE